VGVAGLCGWGCFWGLLAYWFWLRLLLLHLLPDQKTDNEFLSDQRLLVSLGLT